MAQTPNDGSQARIGYNERLVFNPQFWSIVIIFILITLHHYDDQSSFRLFSMPDLPLGLTRHTVDRILYLVPIILSSFIFGSKGGKIAVWVAFVAMLPRAVLISPSTVTALWETAMITLIASLAPLGLDHYKKQEEQLEETMEKLESTQRELDTKVQISLEQERQLAVINAFSTMLSRSLEVGKVMKAAVAMVMEIVQAEVVLIFTLDEATQELKITAYEGIKDATVSAIGRIKSGDEFYRRVTEYGRPLVIDNALDDQKFCGLPMDEENLKAKLSVPLTARGRVVGALCVATRLLEHQFREPEIELLSALGNLIGVAVDNSNLYHQKIEAAEQLKLSENKYRQLFENAHDAIWVQDLSGNVMAANEAAAELFGYDLECLIGMSSGQFFAEDDFDISKVIVKVARSGHGMCEPFRQKIIKKDGTESVVMLTANLISDNGQADGFQFIGRDITKEVRMQENQGFYLQQITRAHEEERLRISRDLHDSTAQNLIAMLRQLEKFCEEDSHLPSNKLGFLWDLHERLKGSLREVRQLSRDLRPSVIDDLGLLPSVEWLTGQLSEEYGIEANLVVDGKEKRFTPEIEVALFRIIQEALRNVAKHSQATRAQVLMDFKETETRLTIADNGKGFEMPTSIGEFSRLGKLGVDGMQTRARLAGGTFAIMSEPGKGTTVLVSIPV